MLKYVTVVWWRALRSVRAREWALGGCALLSVAYAAERAVEGPLATPAPDPVREELDPTLMAVGTTPIRVSDAKAQAVISPNSGEVELLSETGLLADALIEKGVVDEAADQVALAKMAEEMGLDESLEVRAQLALARRRILSSALLDLSVQQQVSDFSVRAAYDAEVTEALADQRVRLRRILVSSEDEADDIRKRIQGGISFDEMARRRSLDMKTRSKGGEIGVSRMSELPKDIALTITDLPIGEVSAPVKGKEGWYLLFVESRMVVRLQPFEEMEEGIKERLKDRVVAETIAEARGALPIRLADDAFGNRSRSVFALRDDLDTTW